METQAKDVMTRDFHALSPDITIWEAVTRFKHATREENRRIFGMIVTDESGNPIGMLSMYDILLFLRPKHIDIWGEMEDIIPEGVFNTSLDRMQLYAQGSRGFIYFVAVMGTTGSRQEPPPELKAGLSRARQVFSQPLALGFGLSRPEQVAPIQGLVDCLVFGSSLIQHLRAGGSSREFISRWRS